MRHVIPILVPCLLLLAGCGEDPSPSGVFVRILTSTVDGPVEGALRIVSVEDRQGRTYELVATDEADVWRAPDALVGHYRIVTDRGWGMLWTGRQGTASPRLQGHDYPPTVVRMGKPRSLYIASADPSLPSAPVTTDWAAERRALDADGPFAPASIEVVDQGEGIVSLHFAEEAWTRGTAIRAVGRMSDGSVSEMLTYTVRDADRFELPRMALVFPCPQAPLTVYLVPSEGEGPVADGTRVWARVRGIPLAATYEARSFRGVARFDTLPTIADGADVFLTAPDEGSEGFSLTLDTWRSRLAMHVAVPPASEATVPLVHSAMAEHDITEVRVRYPGRERFALVQPFLTDDGPAIPLVEGVHDVLFGRADGAWRHDVIVVEGGAVVRGVEGAFEDHCVVRGAARGTGGGGAVVFTRLLPAVEGVPARRASGQGFQAHVPATDSSYELTLPPGRYEVQIWTLQGPRGRPLTQELRPGARARLQLSTR